MKKCRNAFYDSPICNECEFFVEPKTTYIVDEWFEGDYIEAGMGEDDCMDFEPKDDNYYMTQEEQLFGERDE